MYSWSEQLLSMRYMPTDGTEFLQQTDKWCEKEHGRVLGKILKVSDISESEIYLGTIGGAIIRSKKYKQMLLLQVLPTTKKEPEYVITNTLKDSYPFNQINIRNLNK